MAWSKYWSSNNNINHVILGKWSEYYYKSLIKLSKLNLEDNVLDFGAGTGIISGLISSHVSSVFAYDNSKAMNYLCSQKMINYSNVKCTSSLEDIQDISFILINSVLQYIDNKELDCLMEYFSEKTNANKMIISDILPDSYNPYTDAIFNLTYSFKKKFFFTYLFFLIKEFSIRIFPSKDLSWNKYKRDRLIKKIQRYGWHVELIDNLSPSVNRYSLFCYRD